MNVKYMPMDEFLASGLLQEVNRQFFHPRGLALELSFDRPTVDDKALCGIWDYRDDPEGMMFGENVVNSPTFAEKANTVERMLWAKREARRTLLGGTHIQPIPIIKEDEMEKARFVEIVGPNAFQPGITRVLLRRRSISWVRLTESALAIGTDNTQFHLKYDTPEKTRIAYDKILEAIGPSVPVIVVDDLTFKGVPNLSQLRPMEPLCTKAKLFVRKPEVEEQ